MLDGLALGVLLLWGSPCMFSGWGKEEGITCGRVPRPMSDFITKELSVLRNASMRHLHVGIIPGLFLSRNQKGERLLRSRN